MKAGYTKPMIEIEKYELDASVAANCGPIVTLGPGTGTPESVCDEFEGAFDVSAYGLQRSGGNSFYESGSAYACDCYYSSGGEGYFTS